VLFLNIFNTFEGFFKSLRLQDLCCLREGLVIRRMSMNWRYLLRMRLAANVDVSVPVYLKRRIQFAHFAR